MSDPEASACKKQFYVCGCFYTNNIFLEDYKIHVTFLNEQQFRRDYGPVLRNAGCTTEEKFKDVFAKIEKELQRRQLLDQHSMERKAIISETYEPIHPHVYMLQESFLAPKFVEVVNYCQSEDADLKGLLDRIDSLPAKKVYSFPVFTKEFCQDLVEELENFEQSKMPRSRPNTMNNFGIQLNELGFDETFITPLRENYLQPITSLLFPDYGGKCLDSHKVFVVKYALHEDLSLSYHYDNAEVTLNVSLGKQFTEGNLYFGDVRQVPISETECVEVEHQVTQGLLHQGGQLHGALPIKSGERWNLIVWMRSSAVRNRLCPMCNMQPHLVEAIGFGDGYTKDTAEEIPDNVDVCTLI
ncbi:2-oxoglutarate and iron-dependent oxygenase domain-containing protein 2 isoform X2 [Latimeria chalumnae]|uniref:2-oxoglutarate and iron dependent oxygenase domain containing 2 n=1 Tax=Latimeria chalumnae TaxID=7897 RepID=H3BE52_LATCH|nr:PREDICTED: 2-oxoglutarate and iron-dependent oxygenase domain-containing protein 2 isoform X1 [Latimeria chalumnae]|eukprot:XP_005989018.1 PREDICTED: 2-oxoglutarate and iron-dependent oxygenase domain-containing protein 2 isoform X1 [Latimeria chalumnae]